MVGSRRMLERLREYWRSLTVLFGTDDHTLKLLERFEPALRWNQRPRRSAAESQQVVTPNR